MDKRPLYLLNPNPPIYGIYGLNLYYNLRFGCCGMGFAFSSLITRESLVLLGTCDPDYWIVGGLSKIRSSGFVNILPETKSPDKQELDSILNSITEEDILQLDLFEQRLWAKYQKLPNGSGDLTKAYFNPMNRILFIGFEGTRFKNLPKDVPLPNGWKVVIRNIWNEKYAYYYPNGPRILLDSGEYDNLEHPIVINYSYWLTKHGKDLMYLNRKTYDRLELDGLIPKGSAEKLFPLRK